MLDCIYAPIIVHIVRNGGTILIINRVLDKEVSYLSKVFKLRPFSNVVNVFTDRWIDGAFSNFLNFKFLNLRQLPSLVFLSDFTGSKNLLDEAYFLRNFPYAPGWINCTHLEWHSIIK